VFKRFKDIAKEMMSIGYERKKHHQKSINSLLDQHREKIIMEKFQKALLESTMVKKEVIKAEVDKEKTFFFKM
jgi:hypothetical protein